MAARTPARARGPVRAAGRRTVVVIGNGLAGQRLCARLAERAGGALRIVVLAEEPRPAYDRVHLSDVLAKRPIEELELAPRAWYAEHGIELHLGDPAVDLDLAAHRVTTRAGHAVDYDELVFATGSSAWRPPVPGIELPPVIAYRNAADVQEIARRAQRALAGSRRVAIVGGGLLGLEVAWALRGLGCEPEVFERAAHLLPRQLDADASRIVAAQLQALGVRLRLAHWLERIEPAGDGQVLLRFATGAAAGPFALVVVAAGVRPRDELARAAGLRCHPRGGIEVDERLAASAPGVWAIGECARRDGIVPGLAAPCLAMAEAAADALLGEPVRVRSVAPAATRLKIDSLDVSVAGAASEDGAGIVRVRFRDGDARYRCLVLQRGELVGAIGVGEWPEWHAVQEAVARRRFVRPWERARLARQGRLWSDGGRPIERWSDDTTVCTCLGVDCGTLRRALAEGHCSSAALSARTGAGTGCGTCRPLLEALAGERAGRVRAAPRRGLAAAGLAALALLAVLAAAPPIPFADSVQQGAIDRLWRDGALRQVTGFATFGLGVASLGLPLRRRVALVARLSAARWQVLHASLGVAMLLGFGVHTGLRLGANLDRALALSFLGLAGLGALAGVVAALERRLAPQTGVRLRRAARWTHVLATWPFALLLLFHVLKVYWF